MQSLLEYMGYAYIGNGAGSAWLVTLGWSEVTKIAWLFLASRSLTSAFAVDGPTSFGPRLFRT